MLVEGLCRGCRWFFGRPHNASARKATGSRVRLIQQEETRIRRRGRWIDRGLSLGLSMTRRASHDPPAACSAAVMLTGPSARSCSFPCWATTVRDALQSFATDSAAGPFGLRPQHLKGALAPGHRDEVVSLLHWLVRLLANGLVPTSNTSFFASASLAA